MNMGKKSEKLNLSLSKKEDQTNQTKSQSKL